MTLPKSSAVAPALEGYDFYIFEHSMPEKLPADGVILLVDPLGTPSGAGFRVENLVDMSKKSVYLAQEETHPIPEQYRGDQHHRQPVSEGFV